VIDLRLALGGFAGHGHESIGVEEPASSLSGS
jgi:hypothetical protein